MGATHQALLMIAAAGGGTGGGGTPHRYWRMINMVIPGGSGGRLEISELRLFDGTLAIDAGISIIASTAPDFGVVADAQDGDLTTRPGWPDTVVEVEAFSLKWDFGVGLDESADGIKQGGYLISDRYLSGFEWQWSDDNSTWTSQALATGLTYPGNYTLSAEIDVAGNGNSVTAWSPTWDKMINWAVSNGNLRATGTGHNFGSAQNIRAAWGCGSGSDKVYWELTLVSATTNWNGCYIGVGLASQAIGSIASPYWLVEGTGTIYSAGGTAYGSAFSPLADGDILMFAMDAATGEVWVGLNGTWTNSGDPAAGTGERMDFTTAADFKPLVQLDGATTGKTFVIDINCGLTAFAYTVPSGFSAL